MYANRQNDSKVLIAAIQAALYHIALGVAIIIALARVFPAHQDAYIKHLFV
jgi:hypothetical protein